MRYLIKFLALLPVLVWVTSSAVAGPFEDGVAAAQRGDYQRALELWQPLAEQGVAAAQYNLGNMYANGSGTPRDHVKASVWYKKAADQGYPKAQAQFGMALLAGRGVEKDRVHGSVWLQLAASQGDEVALDLLVWLEVGFTDQEWEEACSLLQEYEARQQVDKPEIDLIDASLEEGLKAVEAGKYTRAYSILKPWATEGAGRDGVIG